MKRLPILFLALLLSYFSYSQVFIDGKNINDEEGVKYCELLGMSKLLSMKVTVQIDYGQPPKLFKSQQIKDKDGKAMTFNSMVDALNFMEKNGWEYVNSYAITVGGNNVYHWLLRRKK